MFRYLRIQTAKIRKKNENREWSENKNTGKRKFLSRNEITQHWFQFVVFSICIFINNFLANTIHTFFRCRINLLIIGRIVINPAVQITAFEFNPLSSYEFFIILQIAI
jgi:hypothetical protein